MDALAKQIGELELHIGELAEEAGLDMHAILDGSRHDPLASSIDSASNSLSSPSLPKSPVKATTSAKPKSKSTQIEI